MFTTHDYEMMNTVADRIIELRPDGVLDYAGNYEDFLQWKKEKGYVD